MNCIKLENYISFSSRPEFYVYILGSFNTYATLCSGAPRVVPKYICFYLIPTGTENGTSWEAGNKSQVIMQEQVWLNWVSRSVSLVVSGSVLESGSMERRPAAFSPSSIQLLFAQQPLVRFWFWCWKLKRLYEHVVSFRPWIYPSSHRVVVDQRLET